MTGQPPTASQNFQFFHWEIAHFFTSLFQFWQHGSMLSLCIMLAPGRRIVMNYATSWKEQKKIHSLICASVLFAFFLLDVLSRGGVLAR